MKLEKDVYETKMCPSNVAFFMFGSFIEKTVIIIKLSGSLLTVVISLMLQWKCS